MKFCVIAHFEQQSNTFRSVVCHYDNDIDIGCVLRASYNSNERIENLVSPGDLICEGRSNVDAKFKHWNVDRCFEDSAESAKQVDQKTSQNHLTFKSHQDSFSLLDYCDLIGASKVYIFNGERWCELLLTFSNLVESQPLHKKIKDASAL